MSSLFSNEAELRGAGCFHYISDIFNFNFIERDIENACLHITPRDKERQKQYASLSYRRIYRFTPTEFSIVTDNRSDLKVEGFLRTLYFVGWGCHFVA